VQQRVERTEQLGVVPTVRDRTTGQVDQTTRPLLQVSTDGAYPTARVAKGDAGPLGQVALVGRAVAGKEAAGQL